MRGGERERERERYSEKQRKTECEREREKDDLSPGLFRSCDINFLEKERQICKTTTTFLRNKETNKWSVCI